MHEKFNDLPLMFATCCQFDRDTLLKSPSQLGAFLSVSRMISDIEPDAQTAAINFALRGTDIPGWIVVRRQNPGYVETQTLLELFLSCPSIRIRPLLHTLAQLRSHISGTRYRILCAAAGINPTETAIKTRGKHSILETSPGRKVLNRDQTQNL